MAQNNELTERQLLKEILKWIKFAGMKGVKDQLNVTLETDQKRTIYQLSDGSKSIVDIHEITGASTGSISGYWQKWLKLGLGEKISVQGGDRFKRSFDLEDLGIEIPEVKTRIVPEGKKKEPIPPETEAPK